jgi:hypothetical protein
LVIFSAAMAGWVNAAVLFGNLGSTGGDALGASFNHVLTTRPFAVVFTTSQNLLLLDNIVLGLQDDSPLPNPITNYTIDIFSNLNGEPGTLLHTSAPITVGTAPNDPTKYTFDFGGVQLASSSTFWIVPSPGVHWFYNAPAGPSQPQAYNGSGLTWAGSIFRIPPDPANARLSVSLSGTEVPEPGTFLAGAILLGGAAITLVRRRRAAAV